MTSTQEKKSDVETFDCGGTGDASTIFTVTCRVNSAGKLNTVYVQHRQGEEGNRKIN